MPGRLLTATDVDRFQQPQTSARGREDQTRLGFSLKCNDSSQEVLKLTMPWRVGTTRLVMSPLEVMQQSTLLAPG